MLNSVSSERRSFVEGNQAFPNNAQSQLKDDDIIILEQPSLVVPKEVSVQSLQGLIESVNQLARFPQLVSPEQLAPLPSQLNEALQKEPCFQLEQYQVRIVQLKQMLTKAELFSGGERLCSVLKQHLIHAEQAVSTLYKDSATPVQDSLWPLYERILSLPTLKPDFFGAALATLHEKLPNANSFEPLVEQLQALLPQLLPPAHYFWGQTEPFTDALQRLEEIKQQSLVLVRRLENTPDGYLKVFCAPMESIYQTYRSFLEEFTKASDQKRAELCLPKAQLSGVGLGFFSLDQGQARALLCRNQQGNTVKENPLGTHAVHCEGGVFYKPNPEGRFYIGPEMEFAIYAFYQLLDGKGAAPTALAKISHLFFEGQPESYGRTLQVGYGIEGISLQDLLGMANVLPFLERCLGSQNAQSTFKELLDGKWEQDYIAANPDLSEEALSILTLDESVDRLLQKFEALFEPVNSDRRCLEFVAIPVPNATKRDFYAHIFAHSTKLLIGALALLQRYPKLTRTSSRDGERQTSFTELTDLCHYLKKIQRYFPALSSDQLLREIPQWMNRFDPTDFSTHFVVTLLTNPYDHKTDNLMVTLDRNANGGVQAIRLVGIDNDLAFASSEQGVRSILYLLEPMKALFDPTVAQRVLELTAEGLIFDWLVAIEEQNTNYQRWERQGVLKHEDLFEEGEESLHIPLKLDAELIPNIYAKARQLVGLLKANPSLTHWDLLHAIQPRLAHAYEKALNSSDTAEIAYVEVPSSFANEEKASVGPVPKQTPAMAALSFLKTVDLPSLPLKLQVSLIGKALRAFPAATFRFELPGDPSQPLTRRDFFLMAVKQGHHALVARLLEEEKKSRMGSEERALFSLIDVRNQEEQTALLVACCRLDAEMIRLLIEYGADPQVYDIGGRTALALCLMRLPDAPGKAAAAARFLGDHAAIFFNAASGHRGWSPLHHLVEAAVKVPEEAEPLIAYLIEKGATPDLVDNRGKTPLDHAIELGQERLVEQLIHLGAGRTLNVQAALTFFSSRPHLKEIFALLQSQSLLLRWHLALDALRKAHASKSCVFLEGAQLGKIALPPGLTKKLLDEQGDIRRVIDYGRRNVNKITIPWKQDLFFKQYPEMPGVEYAIDKLFELLIGHGTSFTDLAKLTPANGESYPVLISQGIQGENLHDVLSDPIKARQLEKLDPLAFSELLIASLLVNFEDAKPDNFILELQPNGTYRLVGVDNDHAFVPPLVKEGGSTVQVKCILYCLDLMKQPIHPAARERFLSFTPERLLRLWLNQLNEQNQRYCALFSEIERRELFDTKKRPGMVIPIPFKTGAIAEIYQKFQRLQLALKESPQLSGLELLRIVIPSLGIRYEEAFHSCKNPLERFLSLTSTQYSIAIAGRYQTMINSRQMLQSMAIPEKSAWNKAAEQGPTQALQELQRLQQEIEASAQQLQQIRDALQAGHADHFNKLQLDTVKEKVINGVPGAFTGIDFSEMPIERQKNVLAAILTGSYRSLRFKGCMVLDKKSFSRLYSHSPHLLSLELNESSTIDEKTLVQLSEARYLALLRLKKLTQLKEIRLPHPTLRQLYIENCQGVKKLTISNTLKVLSIDACWNLSAVEAKIYEGGKLAKDVPSSFVLQTLHLKACPKLQPWWTMFDSWLRQSPAKHAIQLEKVPPNPSSQQQLRLVVKAVLQRPDAQEMLTSFQSSFKEELDKFISFYQPSPLSTELYISRRNLVSDTDIQLFARSCPHLTHISLVDCVQITDAGLQVLGQGCPELTHVCLASCPQITDAGLEALVRHCPNLTIVNLWNTNQITDAGIRVLAQGCKNLTSLYLNDERHFTDSRRQALELSRSLVKVNLIMDSALQAAGAGFKTLIYADNLTRDSPKLKEDLELLALFENCPTLSAVNRIHCGRDIAGSPQFFYNIIDSLQVCNDFFYGQPANTLDWGITNFIKVEKF